MLLTLDLYLRYRICSVDIGGIFPYLQGEPVLVRLADNKNNNGGTRCRHINGRLNAAGNCEGNPCLWRLCT